MPKVIRDKFSKIEGPAYVRYRLRNRRAGLCQWCRCALKSYSSLCDPCMKKSRDRRRTKRAAFLASKVLPE